METVEEYKKRWATKLDCAAADLIEAWIILGYISPLVIHMPGGRKITIENEGT